MKKYILMAIVLLGAVYGGLVWSEQRIAPEDLQYEDTFTFKHKKTYAKDPWTWGYTKEFAERFHMPAQWIEPELKGALAVAFRVTNIGTTMCGYGGKEDNCWPPMGCQMDIYYDNKIDLGWGRPNIKQDFFMRGVLSTDALHVLFPQRYSNYIKDERIRETIKEAPFDIDMLHTRFVENPENGISSAGGGNGNNVNYFNREYQQGVGLVSFAGNCQKEKNGSLIIYFLDADNDKKWNQSMDKYMKGYSVAKIVLESRKVPPDVNILHTIKIPESYMQRARIAYDHDSKSNRDVLDSIKRQFLESKGVKTLPTTPDATTQKP